MAPARGATSVGVLDRVVRILETVERGPQTLNDLALTSGIPRPTAHRLALALETHELLHRDDSGRFRLGPRITQLAAAIGGETLATKAEPVLRALRDATGESSQLFRREGDQRVCIATVDLDSGLRDTVPLHARLPLTAGSAAQVLLAWEDPGALKQLGTVFTLEDLAQVRGRGGQLLCRNGPRGSPRCQRRCGPRTESWLPQSRSPARRLVSAPTPAERSVTASWPPRANSRNAPSRHPK